MLGPILSDGLVTTGPPRKLSTIVGGEPAQQKHTTHTPTRLSRL